MLEYFKMMKDSFRGQKKKDCYHKGWYFSKAEQEAMATEEGQIELYLKNAKAHFRQVVILFHLGLAGYLLELFLNEPDAKISNLPFIFGIFCVSNLFQWMYANNKANELLLKQLRKLNEEVQKEPTHEEETFTAA